MLCSVINIQTPSVLVAQYGGKSKSGNLGFLCDTFQELNKLIMEGISMHGKQFKIMLKYCVCDAVARAMVKCVKQFSGYYECEKCCQKGFYVDRMTYPECDAPLRDDESFRNQTNKEHHNGVPPFCD